MMFDAAMQSFAAIHQQLGPVLDTALLVFARITAFIVTGPIFNRKNLPFMLKIIMAMFLTGIMLWMVPIDQHGSFAKGQHGLFLFQLVTNITIGAILGFIGNLILQAAFTAGSVMNNQIGLSSAMLMDPASGTQTMVLEPLFSFLTIALFLQMGGMHWLIMALARSFKVFPLYQVQHALAQAIDPQYLIHLSGNTITIAVQLVAPIMVVTMAVDIMLGVVNRAAQQMPVFQLSFALKPAIGIAVFLVTLPIFMNALTQYLNDYAQIF